jgi:Protein of unknown function (DUF2849)
MTSPLEQKKIRITGPSVVTANRTWDGVVIYRTSQHGWSSDLSDAAIVRTSDEARALLTEAVADDVGAIGAYIAPVEIKDNGKIKPGNLREHIRLRGVTIELPVAA